MRIAFIGCVAFSQSALEILLELAAVEIVGVVTRSQSKVNADFVSLAPLAQAHGVPTFDAVARSGGGVAAFLRSRTPDVIYCFGWSHLLGQEILSSAPLGVVGFHPAALPRNRGRHPLIWALALGLRETASTFFLMDEGADSGPILAQERVPIGADDDAGRLYAKITETALRQLPLFTAELANGTARPRAQDPAEATYWRKRGPEDGAIDWRMPAGNIRNLVRALGPPYPGAHLVYQGGLHKVWRAALGPPSECHHEPGKVLEVAGSRILLQCGQGTLWLEAHEPELRLRPGDYLR